jgi:hypothetical protein
MSFVEERTILFTLSISVCLTLRHTSNKHSFHNPAMPLICNKDAHKQTGLKSLVCGFRRSGICLLGQWRVTAAGYETRLFVC